MIRLLNAFLLLIIVTTSCSESEEKRLERERAAYREATLALEEKEKENPLLFLTVGSNHKRNLIGQTVINGQVTSQAKVCTYKDVELAVDYYSKTGALLLTTTETVYDKIAPNSSVEFKTKDFAPKGTDSVAIKVLNAKTTE